MQLEMARKLLSSIPENALVLDVGGGAAPFPRADWVIDAIPFEKLSSGSHGSIDQLLADTTRRFTPETWVVWDLCERRPWPFEDRQFDFVTCSHLLEDIRDPLWVCSELQRVGKAGYIEVPSRYLEQMRGIENPRYCGYYHHRWLITARGSRLEFRQKPHCLHAFREAWTASLAADAWINPAYEVVALEWEGQLDAAEILEFDEQTVVEELFEFAAAARKIPDLVIRRPMPLKTLLKRKIYRTRLSLGYR